MNRRATLISRRCELAIAVSALILTLAIPTIAGAQTTESTDAALKTVLLFKSSLDQDSITTMCGLMAEEDASGPLKRLHYEKMQSSLSELVKLWQYAQFTYGEANINTSKTPYRAVVRVSASQLRQDITFTLLKFGTGWYISDIEIYFK